MSVFRQRLAVACVLTSFIPCGILVCSPVACWGNESVGRRAVIDYSRQLLPSARQKSSSDSFGAMLTHSRKSPPSLVSPDCLLGSLVFHIVVGSAAWTASRELLSSDISALHSSWRRPLAQAPLLEEVKQMAVLASLQDGAGRKLSGVQCQTHDVCSFHWEH